MITGYAVLGDIDADAEGAELDDQIAGIVTDATYGSTPSVQSIEYISAADRQMALVEFTLDDADSANDILRDSTQWIAITDDKDHAESFLEQLKQCPRDSLGALLVRGLSPRPAQFPPDAVA